jgi:hypothetical protein
MRTRSSLLFFILLIPFWANAQAPCSGVLDNAIRVFGGKDCKTESQIQVEREQVAYEQTRRRCKVNPGDCTLKEACGGLTLSPTANELREDQQCFERWDAIRRGTRR